MRMTNLVKSMGDGPCRRDVTAGLTSMPKSVPAKYFYDAEESRLFEAICDLPDYYPTRTAIALLLEVAPEIARHIRPGAALVEFAEGETIHTENSYKFTHDMIADIAARGGWRVETDWVSDAQPFAMFLLKAA